ncbi:hypothetical protein CB1_000764011 [Camelus ferus]|nr:hypothetical protein CB1_000764011 [Camelus ferus]
MKETAQTQWPHARGKIFVQSQEINQSADHLHVFLLICGLRRVKDPLYLVDAFSEWHQEEPNVYMVIVGPEVDPVFTREVEAKVKRSPGVRLVGEMAQEDLHAVVKNSFAVVNSSVSEGMSAAILEGRAVFFKVQDSVASDSRTCDALGVSVKKGSSPMTPLYRVGVEPWRLGFSRLFGSVDWGPCLWKALSALLEAVAQRQRCAGRLRVTLPPSRWKAEGLIGEELVGWDETIWKASSMRIILQSVDKHLEMKSPCVLLAEPAHDRNGAMDLEVPVLARNIPGNAAVVTHEVTGLLFSDPQELGLCAPVRASASGTSEGGEGCSMWDTQRGTAVGSGHGEGPQDPCVSADLALEAHPASFVVSESHEGPGSPVAREEGEGETGAKPRAGGFESGVSEVNLRKGPALPWVPAGGAAVQGTLAAGERRSARGFESGVSEVNLRKGPALPWVPAGGAAVQGTLAAGERRSPR